MYMETEQVEFSELYKSSPVSLLFNINRDLSEVDIFFPSSITMDYVMVILVMEYGSTRSYKLIVWVIPNISSESNGIWSLVPGYLHQVLSMDTVGV